MKTVLAKPTESLNRVSFPHPKLYFMHIPKTAGTSLRIWLRDFFRDDAWLPCHITPELETKSPEEINSASFYSGHFGLKILDYIDQPISTITWLRDPVHRTISTYLYQKKELENLITIAEESGKHGWIDFYSRAQNMTLPELVESSIYHGFNDNLQTRSLAGLFQQPGKTFITSETLELAKAKLQELDFFGICEWMSPSADLYCHRFGCFRRPMDLHHNHTNSLKSDFFETFSEQDRRVIEHSERFDRALYEFACQLFTSRFREIWDLLANEIGNESSLFGDQTSEQPQFLSQQWITQIYHHPQVQQKITEIIHDESQRKAMNSPRYTSGRLDFADGVLLNGWHQRNKQDEGHTFLRWAGPGNEFSVYFPLMAGKSYQVEFVVQRFANSRFVNSLTARVGNVPLPVHFDFNLKPESGPSTANVWFEIPESCVKPDQPYTEVIFRVEGELVRSTQAPDHPHSLATDGFNFHSIEASLEPSQN